MKVKYTIKESCEPEICSDYIDFKAIPEILNRRLLTWIIKTLSKHGIQIIKEDHQYSTDPLFKIIKDNKVIGVYRISPEANVIMEDKDEINK